MACQRCHRRKVRCSGGDRMRNVPCQHCRAAAAECVYPNRDRNVSVSESYLKALENAVTHIQRLENAEIKSQPPVKAAQFPSKKCFVEDATVDGFVSKLKKIGSYEPGPPILEGEGNQTARVELFESPDARPYEYFPLRSDRQVMNVTLELPPYPYAVHLVDQFEAYMGYDYHWYLRKSFRQRLDSTYTDPQLEISKDRTWLCRLLVVFALGESYNSRLAPLIELSDGHRTNQTSVDPRPPGLVFFEQAMSLFKTPREEASTDDVEALNLIAFYSYSLGRRRSAYIYSGLSMRIASSLGLHKPSTFGGLSLSETEHRRRLWWTTYQLDTMTGSEIGMNSTFDFDEMEARLGLPTDNELACEDQEEFASSTILNAHIRLCSLRSGILSIASTRLSDLDCEKIEGMLTHPIILLDEWTNKLPNGLKFDFSNGLPPAMMAMPACRSLASLYIRFYQNYIILVRPVLLLFLSSAATGNLEEANQTRLTRYCDLCVMSARQNLLILTGLWQIDRIAKFGFWESLHLFTSIKVMLMASIINTMQPFRIAFRDPEDDNLYQSSKLLLLEMAKIGNMAAREHTSLLEELEKIRELIAGRLQSETTGTAIWSDSDIDIDHWLAMLNGSPNNTAAIQDI